MRRAQAPQITLAQADNAIVTPNGVEWIIPSLNKIDYKEAILKAVLILLAKQPEALDHIKANLAKFDLQLEKLNYAYGDGAQIWFSFFKDKLYIFSKFNSGFIQKYPNFTF